MHEKCICVASHTEKKRNHQMIKKSLIAASLAMIAFTSTTTSAAPLEANTAMEASDLSTLKNHLLQQLIGSWTTTYVTDSTPHQSIWTFDANGNVTIRTDGFNEITKRYDIIIDSYIKTSPSVFLFSIDDDSTYTADFTGHSFSTFMTPRFFVDSKTPTNGRPTRDIQAFIKTN